MSLVQNCWLLTALTRSICAPGLGGVRTSPPEEASSEIVGVNFQPIHFQDRNGEVPSAGWTSQMKRIAGPVGLFFGGGDTRVCNDYDDPAIGLVTASARF